jgi:hypothetical protein
VIALYLCPDCGNVLEREVISPPPQTYESYCGGSDRVAHLLHVVRGYFMRPSSSSELHL